MASWETLGEPSVTMPSAAMSSPTFGTAIERKARYWRLVWGDPYVVRYSGDEAAAVLTPVGPTRPYTQAKIDMELASLLAFGRRFTGAHIVPRRLTLTLIAPAWRARYEDVFGCEVRFSAAENALVFARSDLERPLLSRNAEVAELMAGGAEAALGRVRAEGVQLRAGRVIDRLLQGDEPTLAGVAAELCMSERSLQRKLAAEQLSFTDLLDARRKAAAERYLAAGGATADEVAFLLGFATPSSFFRAFKRWTGLTPEGWRRQARPAAVM